MWFWRRKVYLWNFFRRKPVLKQPKKKVGRKFIDKMWDKMIKRMKIRWTLKFIGRDNCSRRKMRWETRKKLFNRKSVIFLWFITIIDQYNLWVLSSSSLSWTEKFPDIFSQSLFLESHSLITFFPIYNRRVFASSSFSEENPNQSKIYHIFLHYWGWDLS